MAIGVIFTVIWKALSCVCCIPCNSGIFKVSSHQATVIIYLYLFYFYEGLALLLYYTASEQMMEKFKKFIECPLETAESCYGASLFFRITAALTTFFLVMLLLMLTRDDFSYRVNRHGWFFKWIAPALMFIGFCFIPNQYFEYFAKWSKYAGVGYLVLQDVSYLMFFRAWGRTWGKKIGQNLCYGILGTFVSIVGFAGSVAIIGAEYLNFWVEGCDLNKYWTGANAGIVLLIYLLTIFRGKGRYDANFINAGLFSLYMSYFFFSGMASDTDTGTNSKVCSNIYSHERFVYGEVGIGVFLCTLVFIALSCGKSHPIFKESESSKDKDIYLRNLHAAANNATKSENEAYDKLEYRTWKFAWIFLFLGFLSLFFMNIVNNWGTVPLNGQGEIWSYGTDQAGHYIKIGNALCSAAIYILWLLLGYCTKDDRDEKNRVPGNNPSKYIGKYGGEMGALPPLNNNRYGNWSKGNGEYQ